MIVIKDSKTIYLVQYMDLYNICIYTYVRIYDTHIYTIKIMSNLSENSLGFKVLI